MAGVTVHNVSELGGAVQECVTDLRDIAKHGSRRQFRTTMGEVGYIVANELSKTFQYSAVTIASPLQAADGNRLSERPVLGTILRAGLPLYQGVLKAFPEADNAFIAAYRKHGDKGDFTIQTDYVTCPELTNKILIMADPMLATGSSMLDAIDRLIVEGGKPAEVHVIAAIAAAPGIERVRLGLEDREFERASIWTAAVDPELNEHGYIVPGLGDAGDLAFGPKIQS